MLEKLKSITYRTLRASEKYTKTDMVYLVQSGFWVLFGQTTTSVLSFILVIAFANLVSKETYGVYRYVLSIAGILNIFTLTGMNQAVIQAVATGKEYALKVSVKYQLKWNLLIMAAGVILGAYYLLSGNLTLAISFLVMGIFSPLTAAFNTYNSYLAGKKKFKQVNIFGFISALIYVLGMIIAIYLGHNLVIWLVVGYSLTTFLSNLIFYIIVLKIYKPVSTTDSETETKEVLKYWRHLTLVDYLAPIASQLDSIILHHFWGAPALATYSLANAMPNRATGMLKTYTGIGFPKFSEKTKEQINFIFWRRIFQGLGIGAVCTIAYIALSPFLFHYLLPKYLDGLFYSQLLAISFITALPNRYISLLLMAQRLSKTILTNNLIQNAIQILLYIALGVWGGIFGLVIAKTSFAFISMIINITIWRLVSRKEPI